MERKRTEKQIRNRRRHDFLLTFFSGKDKYAVRKINGFYLVKQYNANLNEWEVAIHTQETFEKIRDYVENQKKISGIEYIEKTYGTTCTKWRKKLNIT